MEAEYIKREDALNAIRKSPISNMGTRIFCIDAIADIPAADVVPRELYQRALSDVVTLSVERKRGKWIYQFHEDEVGVTCSECEGYAESFARWIYDEGYRIDYNYCPNCGAKMESADDV